MTNYKSALDRNELLSKFQKYYELTDDAKKNLLEIVDEMDAELVDRANNASATRNEMPSADWYASVLYIHGRFYADLCIGCNNIDLTSPTLADAAQDLNIADQYGFDFDELMREVDWTFTWGVE